MQLALGLCAVISAGCSSLGSSAQPRDCTTPAEDKALVEQLFHRIQLERDKEGVPPLTLDPTLCEVAEDYACTMIEDGFFDHEDPSTSSTPLMRVAQTDYSFAEVGENLAAGQRSAEEVVEQWMASEGHRENILYWSWKETGLAVRTGGEYGIYWVQVFADPLDADEVTAEEVVFGETGEERELPEVHPEAPASEPHDGVLVIRR